MSNVHFLAGHFKTLVARLREADGYAMGNAADPDSVANSTGLSAYVVEHPIDFSYPEITRVEAEESGGNKFRGKMDLGTSTISSINMSFSSHDADFNAIVTNSLVDSTSWSGWEIASADVISDDPPQVGVWFLCGAQGRDTAAPAKYGKNRIRVVYATGTMTPINPGGSTSGGTNPLPTRYNFVPTLVEILPNGISISALALGGQTKSVAPEFFNNNQIHVFTYVAAAADTTFTLPYKPLFSDVTSGTTKNIVTLNGVAQAPTSINTDTGVVTFTAGADGDVWQVWYPTAYVATA